MSTNTLTVTGNLTADPELRFTPSGVAVANFTIAYTPRRFNKDTEEYEDGETLFLRSTVWREYAENIAESLSKGDAVIAVGEVVQRSFEDKEGNDRVSIEFQVSEIGATLRFATLDVTRAKAKSRKRAKDEDEEATEKPKKAKAKAKSMAKAKADDDDEDDPF